MLNFADYANRVRCGAPLPPVSETERSALSYFLDFEAAKDKHVMERPGIGYPCGNLRNYTTAGIKRLSAQAEVLKTAPKKDD